MNLRNKRRIFHLQIRPPSHVASYSLDRSFQPLLGFHILASSPLVPDVYGIGIGDTQGPIQRHVSLKVDAYNSLITLPDLD